MSSAAAIIAAAKAATEARAARDRAAEEAALRDLSRLVHADVVGPLIAKGAGR